MEFTAKAFESPNGDVRSAAVKVTLECCAIAGRAVEKFLPRNLKPAIREIIDEGLGGAAPRAGGGGEETGGGGEETGAAAQGDDAHAPRARGFARRAERARAQG